jgi:hypothetical protein
MEEYTREELDFIEGFIKPCDNTGSVRNRIQYYRDKLQEKDLIEKYLGKFVKVEDKTDTPKIFIGLVSRIYVSSPNLTISSKYYILEKNGPCGECVFKNRKDTESHTFYASKTTITEITQEEFDEYLITNIISLDNERKETKIT